MQSEIFHWFQHNILSTILTIATCWPCQPKSPRNFHQWSHWISDWMGHSWHWGTCMLRCQWRNGSTESRGRTLTIDLIHWFSWSASELFPWHSNLARHQCSSKLIENVCLGTKLFAQALVKAWYLPFKLLITLTSNHQTIGLKINRHILFSYKLPPAAPLQSRGIYSNEYPIIHHFNDNVLWLLSFQSVQESQSPLKDNSLHPLPSPPVGTNW